MPTAHGRSPPVDAARAGKITAPQNDIFTNDRCWAIDRAHTANLVPPKILEALVNFHAATLRKPVTPSRGNGTNGQPSHEHARDGDGDGVNESSDAESACTWEASPSQHMVAGRHTRLMHQHISLPPGSSPHESPTSSNELPGARVQISSSMPESVESAMSYDKPLETAVRSILEDSRNVNITPTSAQPESIIPCTPDFLKVERTRHHAMKQTSFLKRPGPRLEVPQDLRPERLRRAPIETVPTSSYSSPLAARASNVDPPPRTSQSSPSRGVEFEHDYPLPRQELEAKSHSIFQTQPATTPISPSQPMVIDLDSSPPPQELDQTENLPPQPPAVESPPARPKAPSNRSASPVVRGEDIRAQPFQTYCETYPDYRGCLAPFVQACECVAHYQRTLSAPEFLFDDLVRVFYTEWLEHARQQRERGEDAMSLVHYYNANVRTPVYTLGVLNKTVLAVICPDLQAMQATRMLLPVSRDGLGLGPAQLPETLHDPSLQPPGPVVQPYATPLHSSTSYPPPPVPQFDPSPMLMLPPPKTTTATTTATTAMAPPATTTSARTFATANSRPDHSKRPHHVPSIAGQKRRAPSPSNSVASSRRSISSSAANHHHHHHHHHHHGSRPPLVSTGDPTKSSSGTANWSAAKKKKRTHPLTRDPITTSQQSRA